ncbi:MAG: 2-aminoethylphosphonate aminotransferase [Gammaproteobacteria bacterium]
MAHRQVLLNPGPVTLTARVREALAQGDCCHREAEFAYLTREVLDGLESVYDANEHVAIMISGSGTCAVEAMLNSLAPRQTKTLVVANGVYGERMAMMLEAQGKPVLRLDGDWLHGIDLQVVEKRLRQDDKITHVASVHHETTTGRLNDIDGLGRLCRNLERQLLLDAVSSFGAEEIRFSDWNLSALAGTANKCLHGAPGVSFVLAQRDLMDNGESQANSVYLDLYRYYSTQQDTGFSPFTPAVHPVFALQAALDELESSGGWAARQSLYSDRVAEIDTVLKAAGVTTLLPGDQSSCVLTAYRLPRGMTYERLHSDLKNDNIVIYAGQGALGAGIFRISCMGEIDRHDMQRLKSALTAALDGCSP